MQNSHLAKEGHISLFISAMCLDNGGHYISPPWFCFSFPFIYQPYSWSFIPWFQVSRKYNVTFLLNNLYHFVKLPFYHQGINFAQKVTERNTEKSRLSPKYLYFTTQGMESARFEEGKSMFVFSEGVSALAVWGVWVLVFAALFGLNEITRRWKWMGFFAFFILPIILSALWFTVLKDTTYTDWFHLAKVYSSTAGCLGFWLIRHVKMTNKKTGEEWRLADKKWALWFPPIILSINILEAVIRDFEIGMNYWGGGVLTDGAMFVLGGPWNYMNGIAGILNMIAITGAMGIVIKRVTAKDGSRDMLWPDMLWFWIISYDLWNFAYTYNCLPGHSWYCGFALLLAPTLCAFTVGKGAWLQHRAHTLALWCMFAQTFPAFIDTGKYAVNSTYDPTIYFIVSFLALISNVALIIYMIYKIAKTKKNPYLEELYTDLKGYQAIKALAE